MCKGVRWKSCLRDFWREVQWATHLYLEVFSILMVSETKGADAIAFSIKNYLNFISAGQFQLLEFHFTIFIYFL